MENFPANSHNIGGDKETPKKEIEKVTTGEVIQKPRSLSRRFRDIFSAAEFKNTTFYVIGDVLMPAAKDMVVDAITQGTRRAVYGEASPKGRRPSMMDPRQSKFSYNQPVERGRMGNLPGQPTRDIRRQQQTDEIILNTRDDADLVLERLTDIVETYDCASVADLKELVGLASSHTDNKWGWTSLVSANIRQVREGYLLELPRVETI